MDKIVLEMNKNDFLAVLNSYLSDRYNKKINVITESEYIPGDRPWEGDYLVTKFYYKEDIMILNHKATGTTYISEDEIKSIIRELVKLDGYEVNNITINTRRESNGYYLSEYYETVFKGITVELRSREKKLIRR